MINANNFKAGLSVVSAVNGTWANRANQGTATVKRSVGKTLKQFNKGTKIGILTGAIFKYTFGGKTYDYLEVILETPIKPDYFTTYFRAVVKSENLDIATVKVTPKLPINVVATAKKKVTIPSKATTTGNTGTMPSNGDISQDNYLTFIPETDTNWLVLGGTVLIVGGIVYGLGKYFYDKFKKPKIINGNS
jgi:hypothetical protein